MRCPIWHGFQCKDPPGHIDIYAGKKAGLLYAIVEDNGVGRNTAKKSIQHTVIKKKSMGMKLPEERLKILNETKSSKADFKVIDLFTNDNKSAGTRVELALPL